MSTLKEEATALATAGSIFTDPKLNERTATYEEVKNLRFGGQYTVADVANRDYDYREESGDRDQSELQAVDDVARIHVSAAKAFGNPRATYQMTDGQRVHSMWYRFAEDMSRMDDKTVKLLNELAYAGYAASRETAEKLAAQKGHTTRAGGVSDRFLVVAQTEGEGKIVRAWMDFAMSHVVDTRDLGDTRRTRYTLDTLPDPAEVAAMLRSTRPGIDKDMPIGIVVAPGAEVAAVNFMASTKSPVLPGPGRALWQAIGEVPAMKPRLRQLDTKRREKDDRINERIAYEADRLVVFMSGNPEKDEVVMLAAARAFQRGTLALAFDANGEQLSQFALGEMADKLHPSRKAEEKERNIQRYADTPANSPDGRLFLSLLPKTNRETIDGLANTGRTVGDILKLAGDDAGRATLHTEFRLSAETMAAMANDAAVAKAAQAHSKIIGDCKAAGVSIIGPEAFPGGLKHDPHGPAVLYVQGDVQALAGASFKGHVLMAGDDKAPHWMTNRATELATAIRKDNSFAGIAEIEGRGQPAMRPDILWLASGHGHVDMKPKGLEWSRDELPHATGDFSSWEVQKVSEGKRDRYELVEIGSDGKATVHEKKWATIAKAEEIQQAIGQLKSRASAVELQRAKAPVLEARKAVVEAGGYVISAQPPVDKNIAYRYATQKTDGFPTISTPASRREIARLAVQAADAVTITFSRGAELSATMVGQAVESAKGMMAVSVPASRQYSPAVEQHVSLYSKTGRQIADSFLEMPDTAKVKLLQDYADGRICGSTQDDPAGAARRINARLEEKDPSLKPQPRQVVAERELA